MKTVKDVLLEAAEILETRGWCQGNYIDPKTGSCCTVGALMLAAGGQDKRFDGGRGVTFDGVEGGPMKRQLCYDAEKVLIETVLERDHSWFTGVLNWNDWSARTVQQVTAALRTAAERV